MPVIVTAVVIVFVWVVVWAVVLKCVSTRAPAEEDEAPQVGVF